jgi:predicted acylesterase/phospholipase RssA
MWTTLLEFSPDQVLSHGVIELMVRRFKERTTPQNRTDDSTLAIAIEGGGMRGAVAAGMAAAIYSLGFIDSIDVIYGSSAGSLIGAYMVQSTIKRRCLHRLAAKLQGAVRL